MNGHRRPTEAGLPSTVRVPSLRLCLREGRPESTDETGQILLDRVVFQYSIERSCCFSIVVLENPAEPLPVYDPPGG